MLLRERIFASSKFQQLEVLVMKTRPLNESLLPLVFGISSLAACSAGAGGTGSATNSSTTTSTSTSSGSNTATAGGAPTFVVSDAGATGGAPSTYVPEQWPPKACVSVITEHPDAASDKAGTGAYCQGPAITAGSASVASTISDSAGCGTVLWGIARDFLDHGQAPCANPSGTPHPDFGAYCCGNPQGTVLSDLGIDGKPVYNPANVTGNYPDGGVGLTGKAQFDQWYRDTPGVNVPYLVGFDLIPSGDGKTSIFASRLYFPLDSAGFDVSGCSDTNYGTDGKRHNFRFTTELHTKFKYLGGEVFSFFGDDDVWVFINQKLALDLGGVHSRMEGTITLDTKASALGLVIGQVYGMDLFQAERFGSESNFEITTSMTFVDCGINPTTIIN